MKTIALALFALLLYGLPVCAQADIYAIKPGENVNTSLPNDVKFHYPKFIQGTVVFRDNTQSNALLNYNLLSEEMQFVAPKGDTLAVTNEATIKFVLIDKDTFFYDKKFLQLVAGNAMAKLAKREAITIGDVKKAGAYGQLSSSSSITTIRSMNSNVGFTNLTENKQINLSKSTTFYVGDPYNHFLPANKKNLSRLFGKKQRALEQYLKEHKVFFNKEEDLRDLIDFLGR